LRIYRPGENKPRKDCFHHERSGIDKKIPGNRPLGGASDQEELLSEGGIV